MDTQKIDILNIFLILISLVLAYFLPFELFLFSYAEPNPRFCSLSEKSANRPENSLKQAGEIDFVDWKRKLPAEVEIKYRDQISFETKRGSRPCRDKPVFHSARSETRRSCNMES